MPDSAQQSWLRKWNEGWKLLIDKSGGMTSHSVVDEVRAITGERQIGHAGALDPMATGLLVLGVGKATKDLQQGLESRKRYLAEITLGKSSPTWDADAEWTLECHPPAFSGERIEAVVQRVRDRGEQIPPMYAALKRRGRPLYQVARQGWWLMRVSRPTKIFTLNVLEYHADSGQLTLDVEGGGGLYVRAIAQDIGIELGIPALLSGLRRTEVGEDRIEQAITLDDLRVAWPAANQSL